MASIAEEKVREILGTAVDVSGNIMLEYMQDYCLKRLRLLEQQREEIFKDKNWVLLHEAKGQIEAYRDIIVVCQARKVRGK